MDLKRKISLVLALALALCMCAAAEPETDLDAANARIAELEAQVELYRPYYEKQIVAEFGEGGIVWLEDAQATYQQTASMYAQYGIPVEQFASEIKQSILESMVQKGVLDAKAAELGIGQPDEDTVATLTEAAASDFESYVTYYTSYFAQEGASDEDNRQATIAGLNAVGISEETILNDRLENYASEQLHDYVTKDVAVTDEDIEAKYQAMIEAQKEAFADDYAYNSSRMGQDVIAWNPEGYRAVKHVLIKFSDEQSKQYNELHDAMHSLEDELAALDGGETEAADAETEVAEAETEVAETETETEKPEQPPRTREEIQADIGAIGASLEALYSELLPRAQEVVDAFNNGTSFDELIAQYNEDPGMASEPTATMGYAVRAESEYWDPAFTEGAMAIAEPGQISEPVRGQNGIHIIYYLSDIASGEVPLDDIREDVASAALTEKVQTTYDAQVTAWVEEANPVYHLDRFIG
ncbi:MAG: peptidylprolyl isomerase [bacterium]